MQASSISNDVWLSWLGTVWAPGGCHRIAFRHGGVAGLPKSADPFIFQGVVTTPPKLYEASEGQNRFFFLPQRKHNWRQDGDQRHRERDSYRVTSLPLHSGRRRGGKRLILWRIGLCTSLTLGFCSSRSRRWSSRDSLLMAVCFSLTKFPPRPNGLVQISVLRNWDSKI